MVTTLFQPGETLSAGQLNGYLQGGDVTIELDGELGGRADVVFPRAFTERPFVVATVAYNTFSGMGGVYATRIGNVTATGCSISIYRVDSTTLVTAGVVASWIAIGEPAA